MINEQVVLKALSQIIDPDFNRDIVSLGFIKNMKLEGAKVSFDIALTTPACPVKSEFQRQAEQFVGAVPGIKEVKVNMTSQPFQRPATAQDVPDTLTQVRSIIAVSSCKGGDLRWGWWMWTSTGLRFRPFLIYPRLKFM